MLSTICFRIPNEMQLLDIHVVCTVKTDIAHTGMASYYSVMLLKMNKVLQKYTCLYYTTLLIFFLLLQQDSALIRFNPTVLQLLL